MNETCMMCDKPATWIRSTQFAGDHPFCEEHAKQEEGFGINDSYEYWYRPGILRNQGIQSDTGSN